MLLFWIDYKVHKSKCFSKNYPIYGNFHFFDIMKNNTLRNKIYKNHWTHYICISKKIVKHKTGCFLVSKKGNSHMIQKCYGIIFGLVLSSDQDVIRISKEVCYVRSQTQKRSVTNGIDLNNQDKTLIYVYQKRRNSFQRLKVCISFFIA